MRLASTLILVTALLVRAGVAPAAWTVDANGACVEKWAADDLLRGPTAIANGPLLPLRTMAGGAEYAWNTSEWWPWQIAGLGTAVVIISGAAGVVEGVWWMCTGLVDTLTGGALQVAPERAVQLSIQPELPLLIADAKPTPQPTTDRCGRPLATAQ